MEIIYCNPENQESGRWKEETGKLKPAFGNCKEETAKQKRETRDWIKKRGYRKPETSTRPVLSESGIRRLKLSETGYRDAFLFRHTKDERFNKEVEYWKEFLRKSGGGKAIV